MDVQINNGMLSRWSIRHLAVEHVPRIRLFVAPPDGYSISYL